MCYNILLCRKEEKLFKNPLFLRDRNLAVSFLANSFLSLKRQNSYKDDISCGKEIEVIGRIKYESKNN